MKDFEYKDIKSVEKLFTCFEPARIKRALGYREAREIARLALNKTFSRVREAEAIAAVYDYFNSPEPETKPPECICPAASGTRWHDQPVTWAYSAYNQDIPNTAGLIRANWLEIQRHCNLEVIETAEANCNICITNEALDGRGGTLGIAYIPASGDRMSACGPMCGNIIIDKDEIWTPDFLQTVLLHEMIHAVGIPHNVTDRSSVMYPAYQGPRLTLDQWTINELKKRYPETVLA